MRNVVKGLFLSAVLVALTGCGVNGKWTMQSVTPETAKAHCPIQAVCLMDDGTYQSCSQMGGKCKMEKGTYTYDGGTKALTFKNAEGKEFKYTATVCGLSGEMKITGGEKGKEWTAVMKKGECPNDCCKGDKAGCNPKVCDPKTCKQQCGADKKTDAKADGKKPEAKAEPKAEPKKAETAAKAEPKKADTGKTESKQTDKTNK